MNVIWILKDGSRWLEVILDPALNKYQHSDVCAQRCGVTCENRRVGCRAQRSFVKNFMHFLHDFEALIITPKTTKKNFKSIHLQLGPIVFHLLFIDIRSSPRVVPHRSRPCSQLEHHDFRFDNVVDI